MYRGSNDMETGFVSAGRSSGSDSSSSAGSWKDAFVGTTQRKIITAVSALAVFVLLITTIAFAAKDRTDSNNANPSPTPTPNLCPTGCVSGILPTVYRSTQGGDFVTYAGTPDTTPAAMPVNFTVAFTADTYITVETANLYRILKGEGAEFIAISGDLDYVDYPQGWDDLITSTVGADYPMLVAAGNHDYAIWPQYQQKIVTRWQHAGVKTCEGVVGVMHVCTWKGLTIVQIAPGVFNETQPKKGLYADVPGIGDIDFVAFIRESFAKYPSAWKVCSWHKNQALMQTGDKTNETGWGVYNECLAQGAMVMTGHEHSYERSYQMQSFEHQLFNSTDPKHLTLSPTEGIVVVQGLGGREARVDKHPEHTWWASRDNKDTTNSRDVFSGVVCKYNLNGNANQAYCYDKRIDRKVYDEFYITLPQAQ